MDRLTEDLMASKTFSGWERYVIYNAVRALYDQPKLAAELIGTKGIETLTEMLKDKR